MRKNNGERMVKQRKGENEKRECRNNEKGENRERECERRM